MSRARRLPRGEPRERQRDTWLLRLLGPAVPVVGFVAARCGADRAACEAILQARMRVDVRTGGIQSPQKEAVGLVLTVFMFGFMGLLAGGFVAFAPVSPLHAMGAAQAGLILLVGMLMVGDYLAMLIDPAEADVVAPCPVSGRTVLLARVGHLALYLLAPIVSYLLPVWLAGLFRDDTFAWLLALPALSLLAVLLAVSSLLIVFVVLLQRLDAERLRSVLLKLQIASSLVVFGGYYLAAGLLSNDAVRAWLGSEHFGLLAVPPLWFGGLYELLLGQADALRLALALAALVGVAAAVLVLLAAAGPRLVSGLASLRAGGRDAPAAAPHRGRLHTLVGRLVQPGLERAGFDAFLALGAREHGFRSRVYPMLVLPFVFLGAQAFSGDGTDENLVFLWGTLIPAIYALLILVQVRFSDTPDACWLFAATPLERPGLFVSGVVKALALAYLLPWLLLVMVFGAVLSQELPLSDVAFGTTVSLVLLLGAAQRIAHDTFPFSREFSQKQQQQTGLMMGGMVVLGLLAGLHWLLGQLPFGVVGASLLMLPVIAWQLRRLRELRLDHDALRVR